MLILGLIVTANATSCFPGDFECSDSKLKICSKEGKWVLTDCPLGTKCVKTENSLSCSAENNILLELKPEIVKEKILPLFDKSNSIKKENKFELESHGETLIDISRREKKKQEELIEGERKLIKFLSEREKNHFSNSFLVPTTDLNGYLSSSESSFSASGKSASSSSSSSDYSSSSSSNSSKSLESSSSSGASLKASSSGSSSSNSSGSSSSNSSGSSQYTISGTSSQQISSDQQKADMAKKEASNSAAKANEAVAKGSTNVAQAKNEASCKHNTASAAQNIASQERDAKKSMEEEKKNEEKAKSNCSVAQNNLETQKKQADEMSMQQEQANQKAQENFSEAQKQLKSCQQNASSGTAKSEEEQKAMDEAVKQAQSNVDNAGQIKKEQEAEAKNFAESEQKAIDQAKMNVESANQNKEAQKEEAKSSAVNEEKAINQAKSTEKAAETTETEQKNEFKNSSSDTDKNYYNSSGSSSGSFSGSKTVIIGGGSASKTYESSSSGKQFSEYFGLKALRELRDSLRLRKRRRRNLNKETNNEETKISLCESLGNFLISCTDSVTGKTTLSPSYTLVDDESEDETEKMPWQKQSQATDKNPNKPFDHTATGDNSPPKSDENKPSYTGNDGLNLKNSRANSSINLSSDIITVEQLTKAMQENNYDPPSENILAIVKETNEVFSDRELAAMFLGLAAYQSNGFVHREETGCSNGQCTFMFPNGVPGKSYHGRGFLFISSPEIYKLASKDLGFGNNLYEEPELVSKYPSLAARIATWFWTIRVMRYPGASEKKEFALAMKAINGSADCNGQNAEKLKKSYELYKSIAKQMGIYNFARMGECS